jgi:hypothetical protein
MVHTGTMKTRRVDHRREELLRSLQHPHSESIGLAERGLKEWIHCLPDEDAEALLDSGPGNPVRWLPGEGWVADRD